MKPNSCSVTKWTLNPMTTTNHSESILVWQMHQYCVSPFIVLLYVHVANIFYVHACWTQPHLAWTQQLYWLPLCTYSTPGDSKIQQVKNLASAGQPMNRHSDSGSKIQANCRFTPEAYVSSCSTSISTGFSDVGPRAPSVNHSANTAVPSRLRDQVNGAIEVWKPQVADLEAQVLTLKKEVEDLRVVYLLLRLGELIVITYKKFVHTFILDILNLYHQYCCLVLYVLLSLPFALSNILSLFRISLIFLDPIMLVHPFYLPRVVSIWYVFKQYFIIDVQLMTPTCTYRHYTTDLTLVEPPTRLVSHGKRTSILLKEANPLCRSSHLLISHSYSPTRFKKLTISFKMHPNKFSNSNLLSFMRRRLNTWEAQPPVPESPYPYTPLYHFHTSVFSNATLKSRSRRTRGLDRKYEWANDWASLIYRFVNHVSVSANPVMYLMSRLALA